MEVLIRPGTASVLVGGDPLHGLKIGPFHRRSDPFITDVDVLLTDNGGDSSEFELLPDAVTSRDDGEFAFHCLERFRIAAKNLRDVEGTGPSPRTLVLRNYWRTIATRRRSSGEIK